MTWHHHKRNPKAKKGLFPKVLVSDLKKMPIKLPDNNTKLAKEIADSSKKMIDLMNELKQTAISNDIKHIEKTIDILDRQIDNKVYQMYELTKQQIKVVESERI